MLLFQDAKGGIHNVASIKYCIEYGHAVVVPEGSEYGIQCNVSDVTGVDAIIVFNEMVCPDPAGRICQLFDRAVVTRRIDDLQDLYKAWGMYLLSGGPIEASDDDDTYNMIELVSLNISSMEIVLRLSSDSGSWRTMHLSKTSHFKLNTDCRSRALQIIEVL